MGVVQELKPADHELYNQMGVLLRTNGRQEEASHHFIRASRLKPNDADAFFHLGGTHDTLDRHTEVRVSKCKSFQFVPLWNGSPHPAALRGRRWALKRLQCSP